MKLTHDIIERRMAWMVILIVAVVSIGGLIEIVPLYFQKSTTEPVKRRLRGRADLAPPR